MKNKQLRTMPENPLSTTEVVDRIINTKNVTLLVGNTFDVMDELYEKSCGTSVRPNRTIMWKSWFHTSPSQTLNILNSKDLPRAIITSDNVHVFNRLYQLQQGGKLTLEVYYSPDGNTWTMPKRPNPIEWLKWAGLN